MSKFDLPGNDKPKKSDETSKPESEVRPNERDLDEAAIEKLIQSSFQEVPPPSSSAAEAEAAAPQETEAPAKSRYQRAQRAIKVASGISTGLAMIPISLFDVVALTASQVLLIRKLTQIYEQPFSKELAKTIVAALLTNLGAGGTISLIGSLYKIVPGAGWVAGSLSMGTFAAATTYATGQVFTMHLEAGGGLLDFDPQKVKAHYQAYFQTAVSK